MKLASLDTDNGLDVLCELTPYVVEIVTDEKLIAEIKNKAHAENGTRAETVALIGNKINKVVPIIVKEKKNAVCGIIAVLNGKTIEEIKKQSIFKTIREIMDICTDEDLVDFFKYCTDGETKG